MINILPGKKKKANLKSHKPAQTYLKFLNAYDMRILALDHKRV